MAELQMILNALATLGAEAKGMFIWWLVFDKLIPMLVTLVLIGTVGYVVILIVRANTSNLGHQCRDILRVGSTGELTRGEERDTLRKLNELVNKHGIPS